MWQDIVIFIAGILLSYGLVYQVYRNFINKSSLVEKHTSISMFFGMTAISISLFSLHLIYSGTLNAFIALLWLIIFIQRKIY